MSKKREHHKLFMVGANAPFQYTEAYKSLRTNLEFLSATDDCKTILVTSSVPNEGKSNVAINLAITLADSGKLWCWLTVTCVNPQFPATCIFRAIIWDLQIPLQARTVHSLQMQW